MYRRCVLIGLLDFGEIAVVLMFVTVFDADEC